MTINMASLGIGVLIGVILTIMVISLAFNVKTYIFDKKRKDETVAPTQVDAVSYSALQTATDGIIEHVNSRISETEKDISFRLDEFSTNFSNSTNEKIKNIFGEVIPELTTHQEAADIAADVLRDAFKKNAFDEYIYTIATNAINDIFGPAMEPITTAEGNTQQEEKVTSGTYPWGTDTESVEDMYL